MEKVGSLVEGTGLSCHTGTLSMPIITWAGGDSRRTFEVVDYFVEKIVVNGTEDIKIEWREGRQQQVL